MDAVRSRLPRDPSVSKEYDAFLSEIRSFLETALTPELRLAGQRTTGTYSGIEAAKTWHRKLYQKGWVAPAWPLAQGGTGWSPKQRLLFDRECAENDAPVLFASGIRTIGPLLIAMGTPEQRERYLQPILSGEDLWCQGFSETMAGSDLAALQTRAVSDGDDYVVNGSKIWTTGAHHANRMFCLVRTSQCERRQDGITFLLIDMDTPGLSLRPIITMGGCHEVNQVTFDNMRVPKANRVGAENSGWAVAKELMRFARASNTTSGLLRRAWRQTSLALMGVRSDYAMRCAEIDIELTEFEALELKLLTATEAMDGAISSSLLKIRATELHQKISEIGIEAVGVAASVAVSSDADDWLAIGTHAMEKYLNTRAASIYSGTNETHRNLIAGHLLGRL
jgi:acyl-CoA dehydrogenase